MSDFGDAFSDMLGGCLAFIAASLIGVLVIVLVFRWLL